MVSGLRAAHCASRWSAHGPFVMNTREQIVQAYQNYRDDDFGPIGA